MPILNIEMVTYAGETLEADLTTRISDIAADIYSSTPGRTWVRVRLLPIHQYAENGGGPADNVRPVFVEILLTELPRQDEMTEQVSLLTAAIAQLCQRPPENVHILYLPAAKGRMSFGGKIVT